MSATITIERKTTTSQSVALPLPYYAISGTCAYAITDEKNNLRVWQSEAASILQIDADFSARNLPEDAEQVSESVFMQRYEAALLAITEKLHASCPCATVPEASLKTQTA